VSVAFNKAVAVVSAGSGQSTADRLPHSLSRRQDESDRCGRKRNGRGRSVSSRRQDRSAKHVWLGHLRGIYYIMMLLLSMLLFSKPSMRLMAFV